MVRGQAWGVMEVLIAVIIMGFSMAIVYYAINSISNTQCVAGLKDQTVSLENAMLDVALGSPPTQREVAYSFPQCQGETVTGVRFVRYTDNSLCSICPGQFGTCWIIQPIVFDQQTGEYYNLVDADVCVNMPADIDLETVDSGASGQGQACTTDTAYAGVFSQNACPNAYPNGTTIPACTSGISNAPDATGTNGALYRTYGVGSGTPQQVVFELVKTTSASQAGTIDICAKQST